MTLEVPLMYRTVLAILGFFAFSYEVEYHSFKVCDKFCCDFDGHCIESVDCFW